MDSMFLDVDGYNLSELYEPDNNFKINEIELRKRLSEKLSILQQLILEES